MSTSDRPTYSHHERLQQVQTESENLRDSTGARRLLHPSACCQRQRDPYCMSFSDSGKYCNLNGPNGRATLAAGSAPPQDNTDRTSGAAFDFWKQLRYDGSDAPNAPVVAQHV